jgi:histidinol-phosphate aminotransferase
LGLTVYPSEGNFLLIDFGDPARAKACDAALRARGLIVRLVGAYSLPNCLRITVGTAEECTLVLEAVKAFVG